MNYDRYLNEINNILNKYYPVEDVSVLSDEDKKRYEQLVGYIKNSSNRAIKGKLDYIIDVAMAKFPKIEDCIYEEYYISEYYRGLGVSIAKNAIDVCFYDFQTNNFGQLKKSMKVVNEAYEMLRQVGESYVSDVNKYMLDRAQEFFNFSLNDASQIDINILMDFLISTKMSKLRDEIAKLDKDSIILENDERKNELQDELEYIEKQYYGSDTCKTDRFQKEGKNYKELYTVVRGYAESCNYGNENRDFYKERLKEADVRLKYLIDKLHLLKSNNIHDYRISKIEEEINNIGELESGLLSSIARIDGKLDNLVAGASNYLYSSRYLDFLKDNAENSINELNLSITSDYKYINYLDEIGDNRKLSAINKSNLKATKRDIREKKLKKEQEMKKIEKIDFCREYTKEVIDGLSEEQQADLNEWKLVFSVWFGQLDNIFSDFTRNPDILNQIKKGTFNYTKEDVRKKLIEKTKREILRPQYLNEAKKNGKLNLEQQQEANRKLWQDYYEKVDSLELSDIDKYEINNDIEFMFFIYGQYLKLIEEFKEWAKNNTVSINFDTFLRSLQKEDIKKYQEEVLKNAEQAVNIEETSKSSITDFKSNSNSL